MAKKRFCSACGRDLVKDGGDPSCTACAPKTARHKFVILTHHLGGRARWRSATLLPIGDWKVLEIERETPTLIHLKGGGRYDPARRQQEAPLRFATKEEAEALLTNAQAEAAQATAAHKKAVEVETAAREVTRAAGNALRAVSQTVFDAAAKKD